MKKIIVISCILILIIIASVVVFKFKSAGNVAVAEPSPTPNIVLPTITSAIKVDLLALGDNKAVNLRIEGISDEYESIEYDLTYMTSTNLTRGVNGKIRLYGERKVSRDNIVLGTCSSGNCVYDIGVKSIDLSLKFNKKSALPEVFQKTFSL